MVAQSKTADDDVKNNNKNLSILFMFLEHKLYK
jgi:hypothetical protein